jgi:hypothetical protein
MNHDDYQAELDALCDACAGTDLNPQDLIGQRVAQSHPETLAAIRYCGATATDAEQRQGEAYLMVSLFSRLSRQEQIGAWLLCLAVQKQVDLRDLQSRFAPYQSEQALFQRFPKLLARARDAELIHREECDAIFVDGTVALQSGYARLDPLLPSAIIVELEHAYPTLQLHVRLDPGYAQAQRPAKTLTEAVMSPASYGWWRNLGLYRGQQTGGLYCIDPALPLPDEAEAYIEFHRKGFRKLETIAQRRKPDHLTMMLEELQFYDAGLLIGRCIHLDTSAPYDTAPDRAMVEHVDLAINVYTGEQLDLRMSSRMHDADKVDASFRTHLLRAERVPFGVLTLLSKVFFQSETLKGDLFKDQFQPTDASA